MADRSTTKIISNIDAFDNYCRAQLGAKCTGVSYGGSGPTLVIHLQNELVADKNTADSILSDYQTLTVSADATSITADGVAESTITCATLGNDFDYIVVAPDGTIVSGSVADGTLELSTLSVGEHTVELREQGGHRTGVIVITGVAA